MTKRKQNEQEVVHTMVSTHFIDQLTKGIIPWHVCWEKEIPKYINGWPLQLINIWLLAGLQYPDSVYLTWKQIRKLNASVKRGERGHQIVGMRHNTNPPTLYCTNVFNIDQLSYIRDEHLPPRDVVNDPLGLCRDIVIRMPKFPTVILTDSPIHYNLSTDTLYLPHPGFCKTEEQSYSAVFYGLAQSTGHPKRLRRKTCTYQKLLDPKRYSCEQLCVEMTCCYLCAFAGIEPWYLTQYHHQRNEWIKALHQDNTLPIVASMYAQEVVNFILNLPGSNSPLQTGSFSPFH